MNGTSSVIALIITGCVIVIGLIGLIVLTALAKPIPEMLTYTLLACIGFVIGTRVSTPDVTQQILEDHKDTSATQEPPTGLP